MKKDVSNEKGKVMNSIVRSHFKKKLELNKNKTSTFSKKSTKIQLSIQSTKAATSTFQRKSKFSFVNKNNQKKALFLSSKNIALNSARK